VAVDPILAADLSVAADPILAADPSAVGDRYGEAAHTAVRNAVVGDRYEEAAHTAVQIAVVADRYGEAAHTLAQIVVAVDLTSAAAQIAQAIPNVAAVQSAAVDRILAAVRNEPVDLIAVLNAAMNAAQIFPSAQPGRVSMFSQADRKAENAETRIPAMHCQTGVKSRSAAVRAMAYHHRHAVLVEQLVRADRRAFPWYAALVTYQAMN
jgi:hypothetical protein